MSKKDTETDLGYLFWNFFSKYSKNKERNEFKYIVIIYYIKGSLHPETCG